MGNKTVPHIGVSISPTFGDMRPSKHNPLRLSMAPETPVTNPGPKKRVTTVGDTHEELGFGFNMGLNLIIYVLKQASNRWLPSQGSGEMGDNPTEHLWVSFNLHFVEEN